MKLTTTKSALLPALSTAASAVASRADSPILEHFHLETARDKLYITGTDLRICVGTSCDAAFTEPAITTAPAKKLTGIVRALPGDAEIKLETNGEHLIVKSGRSRFKLATLPADTCPAMEIVSGGTEIEQRDLLAAINATHHAMAVNDVRYYLNGMLWDFGSDELHLVATDGHRLAVDRIPVAGEGRHVLPRAVIAPLRKLLADTDRSCLVGADNRSMTITVDDTTLTCKLIEGQYPKWEQVIPAVDYSATVDREFLLKSVRRVMILANEIYHGVRLDIAKDQISVVSNNPEAEEATDEIPCDANHEASIGVNGKYVIDALNAMECDSVEIGFTNSNTGLLITGSGDERHVVMPMRL